MRSGKAGIVSLGILLFGALTAAAQQCKPGDIEIERTARGVRCRPATPAECLHGVGQAFAEKRNRLCSLTVGRCFNQKKAQITAAAVACLVSCLDVKKLALGRIDVPRCGENCGVKELLTAYSISQDCLYDAVNQCQSEALAQQRIDENNCRR